MGNSIFAKVEHCADALHLIRICLKINIIQLNGDLCQCIWKHTSQIPDSDAVSKWWVPDAACMEIALVFVNFKICL